jgi:tRNA(Ile)-lysidine synthase
MSLLSRCTEFLRVNKSLDRGASFLVAVSGGIDSVVLAHMLAALKKQWGMNIHLCYVHHGLREEADAEAAFVQELASQLGLSSHMIEVDVKAEQERSGGSIQDVARKLRYDVLERLRFEQKLQYIATAHHADDQAETLLDHFISGAGPEGLAGIRPVRGSIVRPLLFASRSEIAAYAEEHALRWMEDSSNRSSKYRRNVIRHELIPVIREHLNPRVQHTLSRSAQLFHSFGQFHEAVALQCYNEAADERETAISLADQAMKKYFEAQCFLVIRLALERIGCERAGFEHIDSIYTLLRLDPGAETQLPGGFAAIKEAGRISIRRSDLNEISAMDIALGESVDLVNSRFHSREVAKDELFFSRDTNKEFADLDLLGERWTLRPWKQGDYFHPIGFHGKVKISDYLTDMKIPSAEKAQVLVLDNGSHITWVCGMRLDDRVKITATTTRIAVVELMSPDLKEDSE